MTLTKYEEGSLRELWSLSLPLMLASFSVMSMFFIDRLLLAHYSTAALNAAVEATTFGWSIVSGWLILAGIAEVFVAQYNGAGLKKRLGEPVWQMIWISLASVLVFMPLGLWGVYLIYGNGPERAMEREYYHWMMMFGPSFPLYAALTGFFIGQGKTRMVMILAFLANFLNATLDVVLIFGIEGWVPSLGVTGAAIATSGSNVFQVLVLAIFFLQKKNRDDYGTADYAINFKAMWQCLKVGLPNAIFVSVEVLGWALFYKMMASAGEAYITIAGICQSVAFLFYFFSEGVNKAASTITGNLMGAGRVWNVSKMLFSGVRLHLIFFLGMVAFFLLGMDFTISTFLPEVEGENLTALYEPLAKGLLLLMVFMFFEGLRMLLAGILTAAGDTLFLLVAGSTSVWLFLVLPVYWAVFHANAGVVTAISFWTIYSALATLIYGLRYYQGSWKAISIIEPLH